MENSLVTYLRGYVDAMFLDVAPAYRQSREWKRDSSRLHNELKFNGLRILTIDLPALGKHFDKCLAEEMYAPSSLVMSRRRKGEVVPAFLRELLLQIFEPTGRLKESPSVESVVCLRQIYYGVKRITLECPQKETINEVKNFFDIERDARPDSLGWNLDGLSLERSRDISATDHTVATLESLGNAVKLGISNPGWLLSLYQHTADMVSSSFGDLHQETPNELPRHGPGVVSNLRRGSSKYSFPEWPAKLETVFPADLYACTDLGERFRSEGHWPSVNETPGRLIAVPKTMKGPRLIGAEPVQHQWIQQLVWTQLETRLAKTPIGQCVHFRDQTVNQEWAKRGSIDGSLATIDLSSASDRLTCHTVERTFRSNHTVLARLHACRTRWINQAINKKCDKYLVLKKFAMMGSAVTFPLQSIVYAIAGVTAVLYSEGKKATPGNIRRAATQVRVFGDDIVLPSNACLVMCALLTFLGLKVNESKSFWTGKFRESCGSDWFMGQDVAPVKLLSPKRTASHGDLVSHLEQSNNFFRKGWWNIATWLENTYIHYKASLPIVGPGTDVIGRFSFCGSDVSHLKRRFNKGLQREEVRCLSAYSRQSKSVTNGDYHLFQYFIERPSPLVFWESGVPDGKAVSLVKPGWSSLDIFANH